MTISDATTWVVLIGTQLGAFGCKVKDPTQVIEELKPLTALPEGVAKPSFRYEGHQFIV